ncbi:hypothetical protein Tco_1541572 [Tanacetum coccineum]
MKAVPPPLLRNYIPLSDPTDLDESQMTYGPKQTHTSDSEPKTSDLDSCESNSSVESLESMPKPIIIEPETSEYASCKSNLSVESPEFIPKSVCARNESVRKSDNPRKNNKSPRGNKRSWNGMMTQKLGENFEFNNKVINSPCYHNKELASPEQMATVLHGSSPFLGANGLTSPRVNGYLYKVPTGSTQFLLVVRFSLSGLLESPGLMEMNAEMSLEKQDLQAKLENERAINAKWTSSSKNLVKLIDSSMTVRTKIGLGCDKYIRENEFVKTDRMKVVPPPLLENYIPLSDPTDLDESQMTYGPKQTHTSNSEPKTSELDSCLSNSSVESLESMPKHVIIKPKTSEYASCKSNLSAESPEFFTKSVCARNESVRKADNPRKNNKSPRGNKRSWNGMMTQKLGENFEFNNKACYVCGRLSRLRYTYKNKRKVNDQKQVTLVWNNSRRVNHQNSGRFSHLSPKSNMVPQALLTKSGLVYVNSLKRLYQKKTPNYNRYLNRSVNSVKDTRVHTARPKTEVNIVKASASWVWKPKQEVIDHVSK